MKSRLLSIALVLAYIPTAVLYAQEAATPTSELKALVGRVQAKLSQGKKTAVDLADDLAAFDALSAKYRDRKSEEVAQILFMHAALYGQVINDTDKARELFSRVKAEFPGTNAAAAADQTLAAFERSANAEKNLAALIGKPAPELHFRWANREGLKTLSDLKGKVVVLDFWATWCGPCVASFPNVRELVTHYKGLDVAVVGVTSIQGRVVGLQPQQIDTEDNPQKEMALMTDYIKAKNITWTVAFSNEEVFNPDYGISGIPYMAIIAPDGTVRHAGLHPGATTLGEKAEKIDAILKEFKKTVPATSANL